MDDDFIRLAGEARDCILGNMFEEALERILSLARLDLSSPQPHNLYGILLERTGDRLRALKHYRAAADLDPTYAPALNNLSRAAVYMPSPENPDFG